MRVTRRTDSMARGQGSLPRVATPRARAVRRRELAATEVRGDVVFLVPGLLGFERFSSFGYFADRVTAALRAGIEQHLDQPVPVFGVPIPPTSSLRDRQRTLMKTIADRLAVLEHGPRLRVHLVGHSTGGVDANLMTDAQPLGHPSWRDVDPRAEAVRARIRTVVSLASPHQGACIVRDPVARVLSHRDLRGLPDAALLVGSMLRSVHRDPELESLLRGARRELGTVGRFVRSLLSRWQLLHDLEPSTVRDSSGLSRDVVRRTFVTIAGSPAAGASQLPQADAFFRALEQRASGLATGCVDVGPHVRRSVERLTAAVADGTRVICAPGVVLPAQLSAAHNDGVVNSARQLADPADPDELAGIVVADHFDVMGYYDRYEWAVDAEGHDRGKQVAAGLLHSGSGFRDDQFFALYRRVADVIAQAAT